MRSNDEKRIRTFICATAIGANLIVVADTADATNQTAKLPAAADPVAGVLGITYRAAVGPDAAGQYQIDVVIDGTADLLVKAAGTAIVHGDFVGVHGVTGSGKKVTVGTASMYVGIANENKNADDVFCSVDIQRGLVPAS